MRLSKLLQAIPGLKIHGQGDRLISGVSSNSQSIAPGQLFIAKPGIRSHGADFIPQAVESGAVAVLTDLYDPSLPGITQLVHPQVAEVEGLVASGFFGQPSQRLFMVGVTGTNGKTTTAYLIQAFLEKVRGPCGMIGTIEYVIGKKRIPAVRTTPDVVTNHKLLKEMVTAGCTSAVMEVSSHALEQHRVDAIAFDMALFTNLTPDHLDYHGSMDTYAAAKRKLFQSLLADSDDPYPKRAILNADSPWSAKMAEGCPVSVVTYGISRPADVCLTDLQLFADHSRATLSYHGEKIPCKWPLIGRFNAYNFLGAAAVLLELGIPLEQVAQLAAGCPSIPGRLEPVPNTQGLQVLVDFAHSEDALVNVFEALREFHQGKLIVVFGCGGDRDPQKRPKMGKVCEKYADLSIITSDNPRSEDPATIANQIEQGFQDPKKPHIELDRKEAIRYALTLATPRDIVLIAGKGHEPYQVFAHQTMEFDDRLVAAELMK